MELATRGETIKKVGSTVSLKTISDRDMIVQNKLFSDEKWKSLTITEKRTYLRWARNSRGMFGERKGKGISGKS